MLHVIASAYTLQLTCYMYRLYVDNILDKDRLVEKGTGFHCLKTNLCASWVVLETHEETLQSQH